MNPIQIILALVGAAPQLLQLLTAIIAEVHDVQAKMHAATGEEKSQTVIDRVATVAQVVGAEVPHVQEIINKVVDVSKQFAVGAFGTNQTDAAGG